MADPVYHAMVDAAYAIFALSQEVPLSELSPAQEDVHFHVRPSRTPEWFSAAASQDASLLEMAPELLAHAWQTQDTGVEPSVRPGSDIIEMYAPGARGEAPAAAEKPNLRLVEPIIEPEVTETDTDEDDQPRTSIQMGLLADLADLDL